MGSKSKRKKEFLVSHPYCCFCGGDTKSEEIDHIPSRVLFNNRQWPEGYEFPACKTCNRESRHDEQVVAMLSRLYPDPETEEEKNEVRERMRAIAHNYPDLMIETRTNPIQVKNAIRKYQLNKPKGITTAEMPLLNVSGPLVNSAINNFGRKLFLALYYFHTKNILPKSGGIAIRWYSNLQVENGEIPKELANIVSCFPSLQRSKVNLIDQFFIDIGFLMMEILQLFSYFFVDRLQYGVMF